jgi:topoisomerase-4 subunit A
VLPPVPVPPLAPPADAPAAAPPRARVALVNSEGRLLLFDVAEVPELARGKGNKLFAIPARKALAREERLVALTVLAPGQALAVIAGERQMRLTPADLRAYEGARAQRGALLPRGWRTVERIAPD